MKNVRCKAANAGYPRLGFAFYVLRFTFCIPVPMARSLHAVEYLESPQKFPARPVCVVFGDESFLKRRALRQLRRAVLGEGEGDFSESSFEGPESPLRDVMEELFTFAMFGPSKRLVVVEQADSFVTRYRGELEEYVARPRSNAVLALEVDSWPSNTRLYKAVAEMGLVIECALPRQQRWPHEVDAVKVAAWLVRWAKQAHGVQLAAAAADLLVERVEHELGLLDQELAKLSLSARGETITVDLVNEMVGGWRAKTTWVMLDAVLDGDVRLALVELDRLVLAGENPIALLAQIAASLRRMAAATRLVIDGEITDRRISPRDALLAVGVKPFVVEKTEKQLRKLGRQRGERLYDWLLEADLDLKGNSMLPPRTVLERLVIRLAVPAGAAAQGSRQ
jgi:DNA polymerase III subunit delta